MQAQSTATIRTGWTGQTYYEWPPVTVRASELNHYASKGMNIVRLPISWDRLQHTLGGPLDPTYQANLVDYVKAATAMGSRSLSISTITADHHPSCNGTSL